jgi:hypothetical protein
MIKNRKYFSAPSLDLFQMSIVTLTSHDEMSFPKNKGYRITLDTNPVDESDLPLNTPLIFREFNGQHDFYTKECVLDDVNELIEMMEGKSNEKD